MKDNTQFFFMILILITLILPLSVGYILVSYIKSLESKECACSNDKLAPKLYRTCFAAEGSIN